MRRPPAWTADKWSVCLNCVRDWKTAGKAIIFISHRMEEIFRIADKYSVLRNGKTVGAGDIKDVTENELVKLMIKEESYFPPS